jgi:hypothetical protein
MVVGIAALAFVVATTIHWWAFWGGDANWGDAS